MATLEKKQLSSDLHYSYYNIEGREVKDIYFYNDGGVIMSISGLLQDHIICSNSCIKDNNKIMKTISICEPVRRIKVNLTRQENFYVYRTKDYKWEDSMVDLYLYVDNDNIVLEKQEKQFVTDKNYGRDRYITTYDVYKVKGDILHTSYHWENDEKVYEVEELTLLSEVDCEKVETELNKQFLIVEKQLEEKHIKLDKYYLEKLVKYFTLQERTIPIED